MGARELTRTSAAAEERNWLIWFDKEVLSRWPILRNLVAGYFNPSPLERYRHGLLYRMFGVHWVAFIIPTGGQLWRRLFKWDGWSFALTRSTVGGASEYRYSTCVFEMLHLGALLLMLPDGITAFRVGYEDGILKFVLAGLVMNGYPLMLQRYNRVRIWILLDRVEKRRRNDVRGRGGDQ